MWTHKHLSIQALRMNYFGVGESNTSPSCCQGKLPLSAANLLPKAQNFATISHSKGAVGRVRRVPLSGASDLLGPQFDVFYILALRNHGSPAQWTTRLPILWWDRQTSLHMLRHWLWPICPLRRITPLFSMVVQA